MDRNLYMAQEARNNSISKAQEHVGKKITSSLQKKKLKNHISQISFSFDGPASEHLSSKFSAVPTIHLNRQLVVMIPAHPPELRRI